MRYLAKRATFVRVKRTSLKLLFGREATMCHHALLASTPSNAGFPALLCCADPKARPLFLELPPVIDAGRSERAAPVTMSATALAATSVRSFVALAIWSPASFAASRALATCGLSDLLTRAAAAALAAATSALAKNLPSTLRIDEAVECIRQCLGNGHPRNSRGCRGPCSRRFGDTAHKQTRLPK